jgi:two-component system sensor histidine kinase ChiS
MAESNPRKILSIDDEPDILTVYRSALSLQGYAIETASEPDEGIRMLREQGDFDLLMLDVKMPGKSGFDVYTEIREFIELPVLFVTAYPKSFTLESDQVTHMWQDQFADGTTDILYKPFEIDQLYDKIDGLIGSASGSGDDS